MKNYIEQAKNFLKNCNATMDIKLVGCDIPTHWKGVKEEHNHYRFTIKTPKGSMTDDFWDSIYNTKLSKITFDEYCCEKHKMHERDMLPAEKIRAQKLWKELRKEALPTEYDILACLETYVPDTFEDFCSEFGYDDDSISALKTYLACQKQWSNIRKIFTEEQIEELAEIR